MQKYKPSSYILHRRTSANWHGTASYIRHIRRKLTINIFKKHGTASYIKQPGRKLTINICKIILVGVFCSGCVLLNSPGHYRRPQSAGFREHCEKCLLQSLDSDLGVLHSTLKQVKTSKTKKTGPVRSVVAINEKGEQVCKVDLLKHPGLVPDFAKLRKKKFAYQQKSSDRRPASLTEELPECSPEYLNVLRKMAHNNVVVNGSHPYKKKASWQKPVAACSVGILTAWVSPNHHAGIAAAGTVSTASAIVGVHQIKASIMDGLRALKHTFINQIPPDDIKDVQRRMVKRELPFKVAMWTAMGTACYARADLIFFFN